MAYKIAAVSDDPEFIRMLESCIARDGNTLEVMKTGTQGLREIILCHPDMIMLDATIPDMSGPDWLGILRQMGGAKELPVIVVSDHKTDAEVAQAFQWGADDYILKPCDPAELSARMKAVLRRRFEREEQMGHPMALGAIAVDPARQECRIRGKSVELHPRQFELLEMLMRKPGRVLSRGYLLETIWGMSRLAETRTVDVAVSRLRRSLGRRAGRWVETVERYGYRFRNPTALTR